MSSVECNICKEMLCSEDAIICMLCNSTNYYICGGVSETNFRKMGKKKFEWRCPECKFRKSEETKKKDNSGNGKVPTNEENQMTDNYYKYFDEKFEKIEKALQEQKEEVIAALNSKVSELEKKLEEKEEKILALEDRMDMMENRSRINNIEIRNMPETKNENVKFIVEVIGKTVGLEDIKEGDVQVAHRVNNRNGSKGNRPIVAHLSSRYLRNKFIQKYREYKREAKTQLKPRKINGNLADVSVYIHEHITVQKKLLLNEVRKFAEEVHYKFVWVKDAMILVKKDENERHVIKIGTQREFEDFKKRVNENQNFE